jgi:hypothetical protein
MTSATRGAGSDVRLPILAAAAFPVGSPNGPITNGPAGCNPAPRLA